MTVGPRGGEGRRAGRGGGGGARDAGPGERLGAEAQRSAPVEEEGRHRDSSSDDEPGEGGQGRGVVKGDGRGAAAAGGCPTDVLRPVSATSATGASVMTTFRIDRSPMKEAKSVSTVDTFRSS